MKKIRLSVLASAMVFASFLSAKAQTAEEVISKHIAAIGGADNWKKINSLKMVGSINAGGMEIPVTVTTVNKKAQRVDFVVNGMTNYVIITDKGGWSYAPIQGQTKPEAMTADNVKQGQDQLDVQGELIDYKEKGNKVAFLGKDDVEGTECFKIKMTHASGKEETMYFDASNYYHIRSVAKVVANGQEQEVTSNFSNFQKLPEGITYPMNVDNGNGPVAIKSVEINKPVDESIFKPSEVAAAPDTKK